MSFFGKAGPSPEELAREGKVKSNLTNVLKNAVRELQRVHVGSDAPIHSEDNANAVCNVLEAIFLHGLKSWASTKNFWSLLTKVTHRDVVSQLNHLSQITSEIGMCRAWIRLAMNDGLMESYLESLAADKKTLNQYYKAFAYLRDDEQRDIFKSYVQSLTYFLFELSYNSSVLNIWTSTPLILAGYIKGHDFPQPVVSPRPVESAVEATPSETGDTPSPPTEVPQPVASGQRRPITNNLLAPETPPNTPFGASELSRGDIDEIRKLTLQHLHSDTASTDTSVTSHPDFTDARDLRHIMPSIIQDLEELKFRAVLADPIQDKPPSPCGSASRALAQPNGSRNQSRSTTPDPRASRTHKPKGHHGKPRSRGHSPKPSQQMEEASAVASEPSASSMGIRPEPRKLERKKSVTDLFSKKSPPVEPTICDEHTYPCDVEVGTELSGSFETSQVVLPVVSFEDVEEEPEVAQGPRGNSLGLIQGWSSDFEPDILPEVDLHNENKITEEQLAVQDESFDTLLHSYSQNQRPMEQASLSDVLDSLPSHEDEATDHSPTQTSPKSSARRPIKLPSTDSDVFGEYEVLPDLVPGDKSYLSDPNYQPLLDIVGELCTEKGLDAQNYKCKTCSRPVGMFYGKARVCSFDGGYYCYECHENEMFYIPSRIIYNWDLSKHPVSRRNYEFLRLVEEEPLLDIQKLNPALYQHVPELVRILHLRMQLHFLKIYLFTCRQSVADDLRRQVWPREYLFDDIHAYSLNDLLQVSSGYLGDTIEKVIKFATKHVYNCNLCGLKGFICEICNRDKVIYPFQMDTTTRCLKCKAVYHKECKTDLIQCPKCERRRVRGMSLSSGGPAPITPDASDYTYPSFQIAS